MSLKQSLGPLKEPLFLRYFLGTMISNAGSFVSIVALTFAVLASNGPSALGIILLCREIPLIAFVLLGGVFADRLPRRWLLAFSSFLSGASQAVAAWILIAGSPSIFLLSICAVVNGSARAFMGPAETGILPEVVSAEQLQQANALLGANRQIVGIAGTALGSLLITSIGSGYALAFDSLTFVVAGFLFLALPSGLSLVSGKRSVYREFLEGWQEVRSRTWVWTMIISFGLFQVAYFPALMVLSADITRKYLGGASAWATIISAELVGGLIGSVMALKVSFKRPLIWTNLVIFPTSIQLLGFAFRWPLSILIVLTIFATIGFAIGGALWMTTLQLLIPKESLSRVSSFDWFGSVVFNPLGYALIGPISAVLGEEKTVGYAAILVLVGIFFPLASRVTRNVRV